MCVARLLSRNLNEIRLLFSLVFLNKNVVIRKGTESVIEILWCLLIEAGNDGTKTNWSHMGTRETGEQQGRTGSKEPFMRCMEKIC